MDIETVAELRKKVFIAFEHTSPPEHITPIPRRGKKHSYDPETEDLTKEFAGKRWEEISPELCSQRADSIWLFSAEALYYYLPSYLIWHLDMDNFYGTGHLIIRLLSPYPYGHVEDLGLKEQIMMHPTQLEIIKTILRQLIGEYPDLFEVEEEQEHIALLAESWNLQI